MTCRFRGGPSVERVEAECLDCGRVHNVRTEFIGKRIKCKGCGQSAFVPDPMDAEDAEPLPPRVRGRKKKRKRRRDPDALTAAYEGATNEFGTLKIIVLVLIAVVTLRFAAGALYFNLLFRFGIAVGVTTLLSWIAHIALAIGGVGIFQKEPWADNVTQAGAWGLILTVGLSIGLAASDFFSNPESLATLPGLLMAGAIGCAIPGVIIYCMYQREWNE